MNQEIKKQFPYRFDVFDPRYDILASGLSKGEYAELFTEQMLRSRAAIPLRRWLTRYQALTGAEYIEYFNEAPLAYASQLRFAGGAEGDRFVAVF